MVNGTCCVTGHRDIPADKVEYVKQALRREVEQAIADGYTHFMSGFAEGVDQIFAAIVTEMRKDNQDLQLEAALPYRKRFSNLFDHAETRPLILACTIIGVHSEAYSSSCYMKRNRFMIAHSARVIVVYDGREKGGTLSTLRFAHVNERDVRVIEV